MEDQGTDIVKSPDSRILYKELFVRIAAGDESAFKLLFESYRGKCYQVILYATKSTVTAEELTQEAFINIWRSRRGLSRVENPNAYLYKVLFNLIHTYLCKQSNELRIRQLARSQHNQFDNSTIETIEVNETAKLIADVVERMPKQQKTVYLLSREKGMTYQQIAVELGISPNTARNHLVEALKSVRTKLKGHAYNIAALIIEQVFLQ